MKRNYRLIFLVLMIVLALVLAVPALANENQTSPVCLAAIGPQGTCGDGVCEPYTGENRTTCPSDCKASAGGGGGGSTTEEPTIPPLTSTPLPTASALPPQIIRPTATSSALPSTPENPSTTNVPIPTATAQPTPAANVPVDATSGSGGCGLVSYESRPVGWQRAYSTSSNNFIPQAVEDQEVFVCDVPPDGQICIPMYKGLMTVVNGKYEQIMLVDCGSDGNCQTHKSKVQRVGGALCASVTAADNLSCSTGCAFLPEQETFLGLPVPPFLRGLVTNNAAVPAICLAAILLFGFVGLLVFARRRRKSDSVSVEHTPGVESA